MLKFTGNDKGVRIAILGLLAFFGLGAKRRAERDAAKIAKAAKDKEAEQKKE